VADNQGAVQVIVRGEADRSNLDQLEAALAGVEVDGQRSVQIDVSDLDFFDAAALRRLAAFVRRMRQSGRDVTTRGAPPMLHAAARALAVEDELGLG
jgi:anti-anti-sigma regulatory factor